MSIYKVHKRDPENPNKSFCGLGYDWPSSISLSNNPQEVSCGDCREKMEED